MRLLTAIIRADSTRILTNRPVPYSDLLFHDRRADLLGTRTFKYLLGGTGAYTWASDLRGQSTY